MTAPVGSGTPGLSPAVLATRVGVGRRRRRPEPARDRGGPARVRRDRQPPLRDSAAVAERAGWRVDRTIALGWGAEAAVLWRT
ncbi:hypothetical protein ACFWY6_14055 [Streptomyces sp. NPDC059037]|uniref:hypothetical protein n=1 Tax=Streptomyces sp. NPDC059037 TaxID=3346710 RepID=UPI0036B37B42